MSSIKLSPNPSGAGIFTVAAPNSASNYTLTLPTETGTILTTATAGVPVNGPAFSAYPSSNQTLATATFTKIALQTEEFDTANAFDSTTNYRFQPAVPGYYVFYAGAALLTTPAGMILSIYKNGSEYKRVCNFIQLNGNGAYGSCEVYLNGSTDYVELYAYISTGQALVGTSIYTYFQGAMVRAA